MTKRILVVDDEKNWRDSLKFHLTTKNTEVYAVESKEAAMRLLEEMAFRTIVVDLRLNEMDDSNIDGLVLMKEIQEQYPDEPMDAFILTGHGTMESVYDGFKKHGVFDFINKGSENDIEQLKLSIEAASQKRSSIEYWKVYESLRNRTFTQRIMTILKSQLSSEDWSEDESIIKINAYLNKILPDIYFPLSINIIGPDLVKSTPPISKILCWSRATNQALVVFIQQGVNDFSLPKDTIHQVKNWGLEFIKKPEYDRGFWGTSSILKTMKFVDFMSLRNSKRGDQI